LIEPLLELGKLALEEIATIGRRLNLALQIGLNEIFFRRSSLGGKRCIGSRETKIDQT
jgi:hypothetical protein